VRKAHRWEGWKKGNDRKDRSGREREGELLVFTRSIPERFFCDVCEAVEQKKGCGGRLAVLERFLYVQKALQDKPTRSYTWKTSCLERSITGIALMRIVA
jgi:hypothetical protein